MPEIRGYKTLDMIAQEIGATDDQVRGLIAVLKIVPVILPEDRRRRYYTPEDIKRIKEAASK